MNCKVCALNVSSIANTFESYPIHVHTYIMTAVLHFHYIFGNWKRISVIMPVIFVVIFLVHCLKYVAKCRAIQPFLYKTVIYPSFICILKNYNVFIMWLVNRYLLKRLKYGRVCCKFLNSVELVTICFEKVV